MEVKITGNHVRIIGKNCGKKWHLDVYVDESAGRDRYDLSTIQPPFEKGNLPAILMTPDNVIIRRHGQSEIIE